MLSTAALTAAYLSQLRAIRAQVSAAVLPMWDDIGIHDDEAADAFAEDAVPWVSAGQSAAVTTTGAYLRTMAMLGAGEALGDSVDPSPWVGNRGGTPLDEVYRRPFAEFWKLLATGNSPDQALSAARVRLESNVVTDVTVAARSSAGAMLQADPRVLGWKRVLSSGHSCERCLRATGPLYHVHDLMPIHPGCECGVRPVYGRARSSQPTDPVDVHGELGPVNYQPQAA